MGEDRVIVHSPKRRFIMLRVIGALVLVFLIASPSLGQQSLVGTYKVISHVREINGVPTEPTGFEVAPHGYVVITPTRVITFYTAEKRKFGTSVAERAALFDTLAGWSAVYRVEGDKLILSPDVSWNEYWNGTTRVLTWQLSGNRLMLTLSPIPWQRDPSKTLTTRLVWEKVE
jgi:hypothetical protein